MRVCPHAGHPLAVNTYFEVRLAATFRDGSGTSLVLLAPVERIFAASDPGALPPGEESTVVLAAPPAAAAAEVVLTRVRRADGRQEDRLAAATIPAAGGDPPRHPPVQPFVRAPSIRPLPHTRK
ncbi:MAG: hypothetical protein AB1726_04225 [Planctomycetota bacterium]